MMNLGTMNGWATKPIEYTKHLVECGTEQPTVWAFMKDGKPCKETRMVRRYNMTVKRLGNCYRQETCNDCGCNWEVDSGG